MSNVFVTNNPLVSSIKAARDLNIEYTYLDAGTADERVSTITWSSVMQGKSVTATITYAGISGAYRVTSISYK